MGGRCHNGRPFASCAINPSGFFRGCLRSYLMISTENGVIRSGEIDLAQDNIEIAAENLEQAHLLVIGGKEFKFFAIIDKSCGEW